MHPGAGELSQTMIDLQRLIDEAKCSEPVRALRWPAGGCCPHCTSAEVSKQGRDTPQPARQKYRCTPCGRYFDALTGTVFAGHHQPLRVWVLCLYVLGLNLSNRQIAQELSLNPDDVQALTEQLRRGVVTAQPEPVLSGAVEGDEGYGGAGHKGHPAAVLKKAAGDGGDG